MTPTHSSEIENQHYRVLVENSPDPIVVLDRAGRVQVFNKAAETVFDYRAEDVIGNPVSRYYESEEHAKEIGNLLRATVGHRLQAVEARIKARNGEIIPISLSATLLFDADQNVVGSIGIFKDRRPTIKLQQEVINAQKLAVLGRFAHTLSHDIKNSIVAALWSVQALAEHSRRDKEVTEICNEIQTSLVGVLDKFQDFLLAGPLPNPPNKRIVSEEEIFAEIVHLRRRVKYMNIDLLIRPPQEPVELQADVSEFRHVMLNLFHNSLDAIRIKRRDSTSDKGIIQCLASSIDGHLRIEWTDNGCGIPEENLSKVFTAFFTTKPFGHGLGLYIVKNIVERHGGAVYVESEEGKGAKFTISLPLWREIG